MRGVFYPLFLFIKVVLFAYQEGWLLEAIPWAISCAPPTGNNGPGLIQ